VKSSPRSRAGRIVSALIFALLWSGTTSAQDFGTGLSAFNGGDYGRARQIWEPLAGRGDARSQAGLGFMLLRGLGAPEDYAGARGLFESAAKQGQAEAQLMLGVMYFFGQGVEQSYVWAFAWCELAQINGNPEGSFCRDAAGGSMTDQSQMSESFRLVQRLLAEQQKR
jgi:TPR repeat protein